MRNDQLNCLHNTMLSRIPINEDLTNFEKKKNTSSLLSTIILFSLVSMLPDGLCISDIQWKHLCIYTIYNVSSLYSSNEIEFTLFSRTEPENIKRIQRLVKYFYTKELVLQMEINMISLCCPKQNMASLLLEAGF